jgi:hypothetical protein
MRIKDFTEAKKDPVIKARDPNWRDMEALRKSGAAGSHGDKTKTIPRKEKYKKIPTTEGELAVSRTNMADTLGTAMTDLVFKSKNNPEVIATIQKLYKMATGNEIDYDETRDRFIMHVPPKSIKIAPKRESSDIFKALEQIEETATAGSTSAGNIATVANPHIAIGDKKTRKKYGLMGGLPNPPKAKAQKPTDNALDMKGTSIFGGPLKR